MPASGFGDQDDSTSGISYRAFGGIKPMAYSTTSATNITLGYDAGLRLATYEAESSANTTDIHNKTYSYYNDGSIKEADNNVDANYTQAYEHDFVGRLRKNEVNDPAPGGPAAPYSQTLGYDAFNNITSRATTIDGQTQRSFTAGYTNHRRTSGGFGEGVNTWDAAGNVTYNRRSSAPIDQRNWKFDAAGRMTVWLETSQYAGTTLHDQGEELTFDGDGRVAKRLKKRRIWANPPNSFIEEPEYYIYSSVTGQKITELKEEGDLNKTNVYLGSTLIAEYSQAFGLVFKHTDPVAGSVMQTESSGAITPNDVGRIELEPLGGMIPTTEPELSTPHTYGKGGNIDNPEYGTCAIDGAIQPDTRLCQDHLAAGTGEYGPLSPYAAYRVYRDGRGRERYELVPWERDPNGGFRYWATTFGRVGYTDPDTRERIEGDWGISGGGWANYSTLAPPDNPSCITKLVPNGRLTKDSNEMITGRIDYGGGLKRTEDPSTNDHDGIHVLMDQEKTAKDNSYTVKALPGMAGTVLHYGPQFAESKETRDAGQEQRSVLDIQLGKGRSALVLTLKDMDYIKGVYRPGMQIKPGQKLGTAFNTFTSSGNVSEGGGVHVTLMSLATYNRYIRGRWSARARRSVPVNRLMNAFSDARSPFKCPL